MLWFVVFCSNLRWHPDRSMCGRVLRLPDVEALPSVVGAVTVFRPRWVCCDAGAEAQGAPSCGRGPLCAGCRCHFAGRAAGFAAGRRRRRTASTGVWGGRPWPGATGCRWAARQGEGVRWRCGGAGVRAPAPGDGSVAAVSRRDARARGGGRGGALWP